MRKVRDQHLREMTVAHIREEAAPEYMEVIFLESARFYKLYRNHPNSEEIMCRLRKAREESRSLMIRFDSPDSDIIEGIE